MTTKTDFEKIKGHNCAPCGSINIKPHCSSATCTWVICNDCGSYGDPKKSKWHTPIKKG